MFPSTHTFQVSEIWTCGFSVQGKQRCGRCGGDHEFVNFAEGAKLKSCNCGEGAQERSYAEAAKKVPGNMQVSRRNTGECEGCNLLEGGNSDRDGRKGRLFSTFEKLKCEDQNNYTQKCLNTPCTSALH